MDWDTGTLTRERKDLLLLSEYKYDEYQQFEPGMRFLESLAGWLGQFDEKYRRIAYDFFKHKLIFVSTSELNHLIRMAYPDFIKRYLVDQFASEFGIQSHFIRKIANEQGFKVLQRKSLFLGLSDGAHVDVLRRFAKLKHEQVYPTYSIATEKASELLGKLHSDLEEITGVACSGKYQFVFLIDDFSASGLSYLRLEGTELEGKIAHFYKEKCSGALKTICDDDVVVCIVLYIATKKAKEHIKKIAQSRNIRIEVITIMELGDQVSITEDGLGAFVPLAKEKFVWSILTKHYKKGKHDKPYMGFDECGLPLVLSHNCPNNSFPIIWYEPEEKSDTRALFPRSQRHG